MFIQHYIFKDTVGRNDVWNLGYGGKYRYILVGGGKPQLGEKFARGNWRGGKHHVYCNSLRFAKNITQLCEYVCF